MNEVSSGPLGDSKDRDNKSGYSLAVESPCFLGGQHWGQPAARAGDTIPEGSGSFQGLEAFFLRLVFLLAGEWLPGHLCFPGQGIRGV